MSQNKSQRRSLRRREKEYSAGEIIYNFSEQRGLDFTAVQTWHLRVRSKELIIDMYPLKKRFHDITHNERGGYENEIEFLTTKFK